MDVQYFNYSDIQNLTGCIMNMDVEAKTFYAFYILFPCIKVSCKDLGRGIGVYLACFHK